MKSRKLPMEIRKSEKEISVTLTKRRQGLFNKAAELSMLCDSQIAVLVTSRSKPKVYSFGHSSVPSVLRAFLGNSVPVPNPVGDDFVSAGNGTGSTVEALSILDGLEESESVEELNRLVQGLEKLVDRAKGNPNFNCGTSNSDPQDFSGFGFDMPCYIGDELSAILQESAILAAKPKNCAIDNYVIEENNKSREEDQYWSFTSNDTDYLLFNNDYQDTRIPYNDCWPSSS